MPSIVGPSNEESAILAQVEGLSAAEAWDKMTALGHTVVFDTGNCWCVPPPSGKVAFAFFGQHGALHLMLDEVDPALLPGGDPPFLGYGC